MLNYRKSQHKPGDLPRSLSGSVEPCRTLAPISYTLNQVLHGGGACLLYHQHEHITFQRSLLNNNNNSWFLYSAL